MIPKIPSSPSLYGAQATSTGVGGLIPGQLQFIPGKIFSATVMESHGQNSFTLKAGDLQFSVQSSLSLAKGEQFQVQILRSDPVLELQKVDSGLSAQIRNSLSLVAEAINVKPLFQSLQSSLFPSPELQGSGSSLPVTLALLSLSATVQQQPAAQQQNQHAALQKLDSIVLAEMVRQGDYRVQAIVVEKVGTDSTLFRINGESLVLEGRIGADAGQTKVLHLQSLQPVVTFLPVNTEGNVNKNQPLVLAKEGQSLPALVKALQLPLFTGLDRLQATQQQLLHNLQSFKPEELQKPGSGEILKSNLEHLGLRSEALVAAGRSQEAAGHLKTVLAEVMKVFQGQEDISGAAGRLLSILENSQLLQLNLQNPNNLLFPLPFSFLEKGFLMIEPQEEKQSSQEQEYDTYTCTLHLSLEGLGNVCVRCAQSKESVRIAFFLDSEEKAGFVSGFGEELEQRISSVPLLALSFSSGAESPGNALLQNILKKDQSAFSTYV